LIRPNLIISVIIPNYNHAQYLKQRIDSVLNQTYLNIECIILDDCSTDNSHEIIELYQDHPKVSHVEYNIKNSGSTFNQWEKGVSLAKGEFIWIAESDDWAELDFLEEAYTKFQEDNEIGLVYCNSNMIINGVVTTTLSDIKINILNNKKWTSDYIHEGNYEIIDSLSLCCSINNVSAVLFRKTVLVKVLPFDLNFKYLGDWYSYLKMASISKIAYINKTLNNYRDHHSNISKQGPKSYTYLLELIKLYDLIFQLIGTNNKQNVMSFFNGYVQQSFPLTKSPTLGEWHRLLSINGFLFIQIFRFRIEINVINSLKKLKRILFVKS